MIFSVIRVDWGGIGVMTDEESEAQTGLHEQVLAKIGPALVSGEIAEGAVMRIDEIAQQYGVSRTVTRDVVKVLETLQLVSTRRRVGVTVRPRGEWNVFDPRLIRWRLAGTRSCPSASLVERASAQYRASCRSARGIAREPRAVRQTHRSSDRDVGDRQARRPCCVPRARHCLPLHLARGFGQRHVCGSGIGCRRGARWPDPP